MNYFQMEDVNFQYKGQKDFLVENFHLQVEQGEIVALLGSSGSGKSTILRLISGLEKPDTGCIRFGDQILFDQKKNVVPEARDIGMIFQDYALFPHLSVLGNVKFALRRDVKPKKEKALAYLRMVQMESHARKYPHQCSGGQQQRIAIARALAAEPKLLLLDEPFSNLDTALRAGVRKEVRDLMKAANMSAILVTHDAEDVKACADRTVYC